MHPDLRTEFQNILKPTFNRVDMTEVEILDDIDPKPRLFNKSVVAVIHLFVMPNAHFTYFLSFSYENL